MAMEFSVTLSAGPVSLLSKISTEHAFCPNYMHDKPMTTLTATNDEEFHIQTGF